MHKFVMLMVAAVASLSVAACNTVEGAGEDLQAAGQGVEGAAQDARD